MENLIFNTREPKFITNRRERLRLEALVAGKRALEAIKSAGGQAVLFGSVLRPGGFLEDSDIDICLLSPSSYVNGESFRLFLVAESAVENFPVDISWLDDLDETVRQKVLTEGKNASDLR